MKQVLFEVIIIVMTDDLQMHILQITIHIKI